MTPSLGPREGLALKSGPVIRPPFFALGGLLCSFAMFVFGAVVETSSSIVGRSSHSAMRPRQFRAGPRFRPELWSLIRGRKTSPPNRWGTLFASCFLGRNPAPN